MERKTSFGAAFVVLIIINSSYRLEKRPESRRREASELVVLYFCHRLPGVGLNGDFYMEEFYVSDCGSWKSGEEIHRYTS